MEAQPQPFVLPSAPEPTIFNRYMVIGAVVGLLFFGVGAIIGGLIGGYIGKQYMEQRKLKEELRLKEGSAQPLNIGSREVPAIALDAPEINAPLGVEAPAQSHFAEQYLAEKAALEQAGIQIPNASR